MKPYPQDDFRFLGPLCPARFEATVDDCIVEGELPAGLNGGFYRGGPTWKRKTPQDVRGFMSMDGMIHGLIIRNGKASHVNKWVRTPKYLLEEAHGRGLVHYADHWSDWRGYGAMPVPDPEGLTVGQPMGALTVNAVPFYGDTGFEVLAVPEQGYAPIALDPFTLETKGQVPWSGRLGKGLNGFPTFTAHPKWDPQSGEMYGLTYRDTRPFVSVHCVQRNGSVRSLDLSDAPYATNAHDMWLSEHYLIVPFQPFYVSSERIVKQELSFLGWDPKLPVVMAVIPRDFKGPVRYIQGDFCAYVMHSMSANEEGDKIYLEGPVYDRAPFPFEDKVPLGVDYLPFDSSLDGRYVLDLARGTLEMERWGKQPVEFPKVDERFYGRGFRHGWLVGGDNLYSLDTVIHKNVRTGESSEFKVEYDEMFSLFEPTFAPRTHDAPEGDGYLIVPVSRFVEHLFDYLIFDAQKVSAGPVATIQLPFQSGWTPHGHWLDFNGLQRPAAGAAAGAAALVEMAA